ncbi:hypothetical protein TSUD_208920 [Trifolium subterraneum]|uniref:Uncharacterized protein n=1 Tax=Trifolium subterraneum TaxID=3900 RepID=A0A2Z6MJY6_TRISU|nr:hypothetical protein TSUD_208920 [Trifolium subterraneum]
MGNLLCCVQVDQSTVAMKEGFGKFERVLQPGCHCMPWFLGKRIAGELSLRVQQLDVKCETKTKATFNTLSVCITLTMYLSMLLLLFNIVP